MHARTVFLALGWSSLALLPTRAANLPPQLLPVYGGSGGTAFNRDCGTGRVMTGFRYRRGLLLDAIGLLCRPVAANGTLGSESTVGTLTGGGGGESGAQSCPVGMVVTGAIIGYGSYVDSINFRCRSWDAASRSFGSSSTETAAISAGHVYGGDPVERCEAGTQPARAIRGRSAGVVDAIGVICNEP